MVALRLTPKEGLLKKRIAMEPLKRSQKQDDFKHNQFMEDSKTFKDGLQKEKLQSQSKAWD